MKSIVLVVTLLVIQLSTLSAQELDHAIEKPLLNQTSNPKQRTLLRGDSGLKNEIVELIESRRFKRALRKLEKLTDRDTQGSLNYIVHNAYKNNVGNFGLILSFVDLDQNKTTSLAAYKALHLELIENRHDDGHLRLRLMHSFGAKNFDLKDERAARVHDGLLSAARDLIVADLKTAIRAKDSPAIAKLSADVREHYPRLYASAIGKAVTEAFAEIDVEYFVKYFLRHGDPDQSTWAYSAVFEEWRKRDALDQTLLVDLAFGIKDAYRSNATSSDARSEGDRLRYALPNSTRHLAFCTYLGIESARYPGEYLYSDDDSLFDEERRHVYTSRRAPSGGIQPIRWYVEPVFRERGRNIYRIVNPASPRRRADEYFFRSMIPTPDIYEERYVFTWTPGGMRFDAPRQYDWTFEPSGDDIRIRTDHGKEYLFAKDKMKDDDKRYVYTDSTHKKNYDSSTLWKITSEECAR